MGVMLREERFEPKEFKLLTEELLARRDGPWEYFGADTNYPPTHAKPDVWSDGEKFEAEKKNFKKVTDELVVAAKTGNQDKVGAAYRAVYDSCKSCHRQFKER